LTRVFGKCKPLIGVVHLPPLPGSYGYRRAKYPPLHGRKWTFDEILEYAVGEAAKYEEAGFDGVIVENYGDRPYPLKAGPGQAAALARVAAEVASHASIPVGVNILRNSAYEAVYAAHVSGAEFLRVNSICEHRLSPEGLIEPGARDLARALSELDLYGDLEGGRLAILADVDVKHSAPITEKPPVLVLEECIARAGFPVHAVVVTGQTTGEGPEPGYVEEIAGVARRLGLKVVVGSGVSKENLATYWRVADAFIVGTSVKVGGVTENEVDVEKARSLAKLADQYRRTWPCRGR